MLGRIIQWFKPVTIDEVTDPATRGHIGEEHIQQLISTVRPSFEVIPVSHTGHVADIHVVDREHKLKYVVESKLKKTITNADIVKYIDDVQRMKNSDEYTVIGIFMSLNTDTIPSIGAYSITRDSAYLTREYINKECLNLIFDYYPLLLTPTPAPTVSFPSNIYSMAAALYTTHRDASEDEEILRTARKQLQDSLAAISVVLNRVRIQYSTMDSMLLAYRNSGVEIDVHASDTVSLIRYIDSTSRSNIRKGDLLRMFPSMRSTLSSMKLDDIIETYSSS